MKRLFFIPILFYFFSFLPAQSILLNNFEVTLIGPHNVDRHHPDQVAYYLDYFDYLMEEVTIYLTEVNKDLAIINKKNRKRLDRNRPVRSKDYPIWKRKNKLVTSLNEDKATLEAYINMWENFDYSKPDSVARLFMTIFEKHSCFDLISEKIVLSPKEYKISMYSADNGYFDWNEIIIRDGYICPSGFESYTRKTCKKSIEIEVKIIPDPVLNVQNLLNDMPFHLDGFKRITCR